MNIAVIAAEGRTGRIFVEEALKHGHTVTAGYFGMPAPPAAQPRLLNLPCDATNQAEVDKLVKNQDAVVSFMGHGSGTPSDVQTRAIRCVITAMQEAGMSRLVTLTGTGVRFPDDKITFADRVLNLLVTFVDRGRIADGRSFVEVLKASPLEWTVLRVLKLTNQPHRQYRLRPNGPASLFTPRATAARAALYVIEDNKFIREAPVVA